MELSLPKLAIVSTLLISVATAGGWMWASATMASRLAAVRNESRAIGYARGGRLPTNEDVETQVRSIAATHEVTLEDVRVTARNEQGLGPIAARVPQLGAALTGTTRVYAIEATATTHALLWSAREPISVELSLRSQVQVQVRGGSGGSVRPGEGVGASTDVHGGVSAEEIGVRYGQ